MGMGDLFVAVFGARAAPRRALLAIAVLAGLLALPTAAFAHVERPAYWPDPAPDRSITPATGGAIPKTRTLASALKRTRGSTTRVVCNRSSLSLMAAAVRKARRVGYSIRPTDVRRLGLKEANRLLAMNRVLFSRCRYREIQPAVMASRNNDRVVVMPGLYLEPTARAKPTHDPKCAQYRTNGDRPGEPGEALSYAYQVNCPNDQNLIAVLGREPRDDQIPATPRDDRHGIPDLGPCIRCNLQLEGSGLSADDVIVDGGNVSAGNKGPANPAKDVGIRVDRADGFVLRGLTVRHVREHGIYPHEVDGYLLERFKTFENQEYGVLAFTSDHGLMQDCDASRSGDSALYPGSAPDTGEQTVEASRRLNTEIRRCDMHHSAAGYSGTNGNAVWIHNNDIYDNALGFTTDVFTAAGHPGFPQDGDLVEDNEFYGNNFNPFLPPCTGGQVPGPNGPNQGCSDIDPTIPVPVGTGLWIAGGNNNELRGNHFFDNWRRGTMLFTVPDTFVCGSNPVAGGNQQAGCNEMEVNTSYRNRFHDNFMGQTPGGTADPNGTDFWWDQFTGSQPPGNGNCWYGNKGKDGTRATLTADPPINPAEGTSVPGFLPEDCATSQGTTSTSGAEAELLGATNVGGPLRSRSDEEPVHQDSACGVYRRRDRRLWRRHVGQPVLRRRRGRRRADQPGRLHELERRVGRGAPRNDRAAAPVQRGAGARHTVKRSHPGRPEGLRPVRELLLQRVREGLQALQALRPGGRVQRCGKSLAEAFRRPRCDSLQGGEDAARKGKESSGAGSGLDRPRACTDRAGRGDRGDRAHRARLLLARPGCREG
jgi:hypothetical protein